MGTDRRAARYPAPHDSLVEWEHQGALSFAQAKAHVTPAQTELASAADAPGAADGAGAPRVYGGATPAWMRHVNRTLVLRCLEQEGPLARTQVARRTGLSRTTVSAIVEQLIQEGALREGARIQASTRGGRRAILLHVSAHDQSAGAANGRRASAAPFSGVPS